MSAATALATSHVHTLQQESADALPLDVVIEEIAARRDEFDRLSHLPRDVIAKLKRAGIYRAGTPRRFGGDARAPGEFLATIERIAVVVLVDEVEQRQ